MEATYAKVQEILRLHHENAFSGRAIARTLGISPSTVNGLLAKASAAQLTWPLPEHLQDEAELERLLYPAQTGRPSRGPDPDWNQIYRELRKKGVTMQLLWVEYKAEHR